MHNVEKSGFRKGQYVGYGGGYVWRIARCERGWHASNFENGGCSTFTRRTLAEISQALDSSLAGKTEAFDCSGLTAQFEA